MLEARNAVGSANGATTAISAAIGGATGAANGTSQDDPELPPGWQKCISKKYGKAYYFNAQLRKSCRKVLPPTLRTEEHVVLRRVQDAFAECALGTLSAVLLVQDPAYLHMTDQLFYRDLDLL
eukprot:s182_g22.t1